MASNRLNLSHQPAFLTRALLWSALGLAAVATQARAEPPCPLDPPAAQGARSLTRAEVEADLIVWQQAGADRFMHDGRGQDDPAYEAAYARYLSLRHGPAYQAVLAQLTGTAETTSASANRVAPSVKAGGQSALEHAGVSVGTRLR
ncbi:DUF4148 domain-containing protein [Aquabacterium sp.]|jgi:hypothetical protein|uniref:DUF4148 domain-containing protein n=1 Tax=Aquabacterium sp. TaxID=1872578 RepID=UPI0025C12B85|nr:DUF4148 domain-containing protein [Aquabacterium sp.]